MRFVNSVILNFFLQFLLTRLGYNLVVMGFLFQGLQGGYFCCTVGIDISYPSLGHISPRMRLELGCLGLFSLVG